MSISSKDRELIEKLKALRDDPASTPGERTNAQAAIDRIMNRNGYRRKAEADTPPKVKPAATMTFFEIAELCRKTAVDVNETLANIRSDLENLSEIAEQIISNCGKPPAE